MNNSRRDRQGKAFVVHQICLIGVLSYLLSLLCGCVAQRGVDFGHWALAAERLELMQVVFYTDDGGLGYDTSVLLLAPFGEMPARNKRQLHDDLYKELCSQLPGAVFTLNRKSMVSEYASTDNMMFIGDNFDPSEVGRLGRIAGATHVICVNVREFRPYVPQVLSLYFVVVDVERNAVIAELNAGLDASEQQVVVAVGSYLQRRRARKYNDQNLDIVLRSPSEYSSFAASECCRVIGKSIWRKKPLKQSYVLVEK